MGSEHQNLLLDTEIRWLSRGKVLERVFEMRSEIIESLSQTNNDMHKIFKNEIFLLKVGYLADIF